MKHPGGLHSLRGKLNLLIGVPEERYEDAIRTIYDFRQSISPSAGTEK